MEPTPSSAALAIDHYPTIEKMLGEIKAHFGFKFDFDLKSPVALVLGAEGPGMRQLTRKTCDELVGIPMQGAVESLNVSVASGVCLFEAVRQRLGS